jgi:hypothetical protein
MTDWQIERARENLRLARQHYACAAADVAALEIAQGGDPFDSETADAQRSLSALEKRLEALTPPSFTTQKRHSPN